MRNYIEIEHAAFYSWPAFEQFERNDWVFRFADGYTKRANSITVLSSDLEPIGDKVIACEEEYNHRNLTCIFRLLSFNDNTAIDSYLNYREYYKGEHSLVLVQDLREKKFDTKSFNQFEVNDWMSCYCELSGKNLEKHDPHIKMIKSIKDESLLAILSKNGKAVSCGIGVVHNGYLGIFDIVTHNMKRNKGYAQELISGILSWGKQKGAHGAYVQVVAENTPAVRLYKKIGYGTGYEYYYKMQKLN